MLSSSDVPACPACGSREVHPVTKRAEDPVFAHTTSLQTFYACRQCGRDVTEAWKAIQPAPPAEPVIGPPDVPCETPHKSLEPDPLTLGICAEMNGNGGES